MSKFRKYSIVIHNVKPPGEIQNILDKYVQKAKEHVMSVEPNPSQPGHHYHLFVEFPNQRSFKAVLKELQALSTRIQSPRPEGETREWGRVQVDVMKGTFSEAKRYLQGMTKEKPIGEVHSNRHELVSIPSPCTMLHRTLGYGSEAIYVPTCPHCLENRKLQEEIFFICK